MVSGTRALLKKVVVEVEGGSRAAAPKGSMTYAFTHMEDFLPLLLRPPLLPASRPISQPPGLNPSIEADILAFGWGFGPVG